MVADVADRPAREQRVAVLAVARHRIGDVGDLVAVGREVVGLRHLRPAEPGVGKVARRGAVHAPHFLQEDEIGVERLDAQDQVVDLEPLPRADAAHALVDVVSGDAQDVARVLRTVEAAWIERIAEVDGANSAPSQAARRPGAAAAGSPRRSTARSTGRRRRASRATRSAGARAAPAAPACRAARAGRRRARCCGSRRQHSGAAIAGRCRRRWRAASRRRRRAAPPPSRSRCRSPRRPRGRRSRPAIRRASPSSR